MSRVLVTGASGFIGRRTLAPLVAAGHDVHAVARAAGPAQPGVTWHEADLLASPDVVAAARPEVLLHLAWYAEHGAFWTSSENLRWVEASLRLLRAFAEGGGRRAVVAGSCAEYDWTTGAEVLCERDAPLRPATLYGAAKHGLHLIAEAYAAQAGVELAWGRVFLLYGPDEAEARLFASVARALLGGRVASTSPGEQRRDVLHADDVGAAFAALVGSAVTGPVNIASGEAVTIRALVEEIARAAGRPELLEVGALEQRAGEPEWIVADVARLRDEVGFSPRWSLREGIASAVGELAAAGAR
jgi:nucleoside-diphosphate-sugar epimerase